MLSLVVALALGQCTKDVECKGDRVCNMWGQCVEPVAAPSDSSQAMIADAPEKRPPRNPFKAYLWVAVGVSAGLWAATLISALAYRDDYIGTTIIPVVGPFISYARWHDWAAATGYQLSPGGQALYLVSGVLQSVLLAYLVVSIVGLMTYEPASSSTP